MVRALLANLKTQTRRIVKPQPPCNCAYTINESQNAALCFVEATASAGKWTAETVLAPPTPNSKDHRLPCPYGQPGDRLWCQENYRILLTNERHVHYEADGGGDWKPWMNPTEDELEKLSNRKTHVGRLTPGRFMYRSLSRLTLEITEVRVERLNDISEADAIAEGIERYFDEGVWYYGPLNKGHCDPRVAYRWLWESINGPGSWEQNPYVWALTFRRLEVQL